jgi:hypothetical protein
MLVFTTLYTNVTENVKKKYEKLKKTSVKLPIFIAISIPVKKQEVKNLNF